MGFLYNNQHEFFWLFSELCQIIHLNDNNYKFSNKEIIGNLFNKSNNHQLSNSGHKYLLIYSILTPLYLISSKEIQRFISDIITNVLKEEWIINIESPYFYNIFPVFYSVTYNDVYQPEKKQIKKYIDLIIEKCNTSGSKYSELPTNLKNSIGEVEHLILSGKINIDIINEDLLKLISFSSYLSYYFEPNKFDYEDFEIFWLDYLQLDRIKEIFNKEEIRKLILKKIIIGIEKDENKKTCIRIMEKYFNIK